MGVCYIQCVQKVTKIDDDDGYSYSRWFDLCKSENERMEFFPVVEREKAVDVASGVRWSEMLFLRD